MAIDEKIRRPIGQILIDGGFINKGDLALALDVQRHSNELLGQVLVNMGVLEKADLEAALSVQDHLSTLDDAIRSAAGIRKMLGSLLLLTGKLTQEQLDFALEEQKITGEKLGDILVRMGLLTGSQVDSVLRFQQFQQQGVTTPTPLRLGELLVSCGHITREQLADALKKQQISQKKLGEVLVEEGYAHLHHVNKGINLQRKLLRAVLVAVVSLSALSMEGCGGGGGVGGVSVAPSTASATISSHQGSSPLLKTNYFQISDSDYKFASIPTFYYSTDNASFWSIQASIANSITDINSRCVYRIDVQKSGAVLPELNKTFSIEGGGALEKFPGTFLLLDGKESSLKKVEQGTITFTSDSVMSDHVSGSFDVTVTDYDSQVRPAPSYYLKGVFSFKVGGYGTAS
ncbi:MAG: hypothetical protein HXX17_08615 [Geobacteraceae bacterium]|nr:hypothetical protein [Geobacteraceae bacterium]